MHAHVQTRTRSLRALSIEGRGKSRRCHGCARRHRSMSVSPTTSMQSVSLARRAPRRASSRSAMCASRTSSTPSASSPNPLAPVPCCRARSGALQASIAASRPLARGRTLRTAIVGCRSAAQRSAAITPAVLSRHGAPADPRQVRAAPTGSAPACRSSPPASARPSRPSPSGRSGRARR